MWRNGRRRGLKILRLEACRFESGHAHQDMAFMNVIGILKEKELKR